ncbi:RNA polymerase sigma-70 factor, ECF subfamily [Dyadobacter sp. SG02]|uniref:RNA polymerase sigma factor n=1 Tax=Dyadobacter sp. SG02 TaxID=1855291 RepID=UPI0008C55123|nr:sigma-70 family RNA polymerase sigma factor [Dyadobacter sp. SG02]SEI44511.1 RNA polymerase sigma-70 factor, ECF subfamily [Dyadobacter sp. SG02]
MGRNDIRYREAELVTKLKANSQSAFEYLYDHYSAALFGVILKIVKDEERAADVLQESFLKIWRNIGSYSPERGTLFTWMLNISRNHAIDMLRAEAKTEKKVICLDLIAEMEQEPADGWNHIVYEMDVKSWVARLLPERRIPIELVYFQGYTHEEAAERLSMPLGTVKSRIRKGLQELRSVFYMPEMQLKIA